MSDDLAAIDRQLAQSTADLVASAPVGARTETTPTWWSTTDAMTMSATTLVFGVVILAMLSYILRNERDAGVALRVFGTVLVIVVTLFLVVAGYDDKQLAAPLGLLGTIVGYLLGRDGSARSKGD